MFFSKPNFLTFLGFSDHFPNCSSHNFCNEIRFCILSVFKDCKKEDCAHWAWFITFQANNMHDNKILSDQNLLRFWENPKENWIQH